MEPVIRMGSKPRRRRQAQFGLAATLHLGSSGPVMAHDFKLGPLRIDHPCAMPKPTGAADGAVRLRSIRNPDDQSDRLIGALTPMTRVVESRCNVVDAQNFMRMRAIEGTDLQPKAELKPHPREHPLMPIDLSRPLNDDDHYPMTLSFEHAGMLEVMVSVQQPGRAGRRARTDRVIYEAGPTHRRRGNA